MRTAKFLRFGLLALLVGVVLCHLSAARADLPPLGPIPAEASGPSIDPVAATRAYLATMPPEAKARSDAYFEGGYWLLLWDALLTIGISVLLLATGWSAAWRDRAAAISKSRFVQVAIYAIIFVVVTFVLGFPMTVYESFYREHQYQMATQTFGPWLGDQAKGLLVQMILFAIFLPVLYAVFRRAPRTWWVWGSGVAILFAAVGSVVGPIFISPIFNKYTPLTDPVVREPILALAKANQIPVNNVYEVDASKQTTRVSANVSGGFGVARINLNDNLLRRCSLPEIRQVMAHEMGHYVLNHVYKLLLEFSAMALLYGAISSGLFDAAMRRWGGAWRVEGITDPAAFPLLVLILTALGLIFTPLSNSISREVETEADAFGINTSREPDGFAQSAIKLAEYRKMGPGALEEIIFYDHPSGRARIRMAMEWKAAHLPAGTVPQVVDTKTPQ